MKRKMAYVITCLLVSGLCFNTTFKANASKKESISQAFEKRDTPCITIDNQGIKDKKNWNLFVHNSQNKKVTDMRIKYQYDKILYKNSSDRTEQYEAYLHFDGENYCYSRGGLDEKYTYLLELTGRSNNAVRNATVVILSDELYSFEQVEKDMYSSNSADHIPYRLLFFY